jgi:hypothetical protein
MLKEHRKQNFGSKIQLLAMFQKVANVTARFFARRGAHSAAPQNKTEVAVLVIQLCGSFA